MSNPEAEGLGQVTSCQDTTPSHLLVNGPYNRNHRGGQQFLADALFARPVPKIDKEMT